jgi:RNA recognition motif-containing protein
MMNPIIKALQQIYAMSMIMNLYILEDVCVFVGNLPKEMDEEKLKKMFVKKGVAVKEVRKPAKKRYFFLLIS